MRSTDLTSEDKAILDHQVDSLERDKPAAISDGHRPFLHERQLLRGQFQGQRSRVDTFAHARPQLAMNGQTAPDSPARQIFEIFWQS